MPRNIGCLFKNDFPAADFLISIFMSALQSYRHDTVLRPFPPQFYLNSDVKDFESLKECAARIPCLAHINEADVDDECYELTQWIVKPKNYHIKAMSEQEIIILHDQLADSSQWCSPSHVFEVIPCTTSARRFDELRSDRDVFLTYHGSRIENFHSILHNGLVSHMNKNGLFGEGTYLSTAISVSLNYSPVGRAWGSSCLGERLSCVAVCEVIDDPSVKCHTKDRARSRIADSEGGQIPDKYYVATNNEMVRVRYLLVYTESPTSVRAPRVSRVTSFFLRHKFLCLMVIYVIILVGIGLMNSKSFFNRRRF